jgi:hypothetical protein
MAATVAGIILTSLNVVLPVVAAFLIIPIVKAAIAYFGTENERTKAAAADRLLWLVPGAAMMVAAPIWLPALRTLIGV